MYRMRSITIRWMLLAPLWFQFCGEANGEKPLADRASSSMQSAVRQQQLCGAVGVRKGTNVILLQGYGFADAEHAVKNTPTTKFRIGSLTKQFTAMAVMILCERERLELRAPVSTYMKSTPKAWKGITIHHLLTHTSGIPSFTSMEDYGPKMALPQTTDEMLERFIDQPLDFPPGRGFRYSNSGYFLLGMIIETVTKQSFEDFIHETIFDPLNMDESGYDHYRTIIPDRAEGYDIVNREKHRAEYLHMSQPFAAGALYSSVNDLLKWDRALRERKLLSEDGYERMWKIDRSNYAYGWSVAETDGLQVHCHGGGINGFASFILRIPSDELCVVVLSNHSATESGRIARELAMSILDRKFALPQIKNIVDAGAP